MPAACLVFAIHQPYLLRRYSIFDASPHYFDAAATAREVRRAAEACYLPATRTLLDLARKHEPFRAAFAISGTAVELLEQHAPEVLQHLHALAATGRCEFLGGTYYHSLAVLYSRGEFVEQVLQHRQMVKRLFGVVPQVFAGTELIYNDDAGRAVQELGFGGVLAEGVESVLASRSSSFVYATPGTGRKMKVLLRHRALSDAAGRRLADPTAEEFPLTDEKLVEAVARIGGQVCTLAFDLESFGLWQGRETGALELLASVPRKLAGANCLLATPSECLERFESAGELEVPHMTSWCGAQRDLAAWLGNEMQKNALQELYRLEPAVKARRDEGLLRDFRLLTSADHAGYLATRTPADEAERRKSPYESPYDAYINFMNVLDNMKVRSKG